MPDHDLHRILLGILLSAELPEPPLIRFSSLEQNTNPNTLFMLPASGEQHIRPAQGGQCITEKWLESLSDGVKALALLCARCHTAGDQFNLSVRYMQSQSAISGVVNWMVLYLDEMWTHLLKWEHEGILTPERLSRYADAIYTQGAPTRMVFGWPDCTKFHICQPSQF
ncbi:hypothetical protein K439DRAFT_1616684 [Ramaria rubella]|nr:hypothetical protein K439DRAFT_1616684 [Ramaria rubella]